MNSKARMNLSELGLSGMEIDALDKITDIGKGMSELGDKDDYSRKVNSIIRKNISLSEEVSILRKAVKMLCDKEGVSYGEFDDYFRKAEEAKEKAK